VIRERVEVVEWEKRPEVVVGFDSRRDAEGWARDVRDTNQYIPSRVVGGLQGPALEAEASFLAGEPVVKVRARHIVGWLEVAGRTLVVLPKFAIEEDIGSAGSVFGRILEYSQSGRFALHGLVAGTSARGSIADIFARAFLREIQPAMQQGLPHGYVRQRVRSPVLSGRLLHEALYPEIIYAPHLLPQDAQRYHADIPVSRLLKWCCWSLRRLVRSPLLMGTLAEVESRFLGVPTVLPHEAQLWRMRLPPAQVHFQPAVDLARLLARNRLVAPGPGRRTVPGFVFSGWHVFQEYCRRLLREAVGLLGEGWRLSSSQMLLATPASGKGGALRCEPDFILSHAGRPIAALDAKYKKSSKAVRPDEANVYQAVCSARALDAPIACLVQPAPLKPEVHSWDLVGGGMPETIRVLCVNPATVSTSSRHRRHVDAVARIIKKFR